MTLLEEIQAAQLVMKQEREEREAARAFGQSQFSAIADELNDIPFKTYRGTQRKDGKFTVGDNKLLFVVFYGRTSPVIIADFDPATVRTSVTFNPEGYNRAVTWEEFRVILVKHLASEMTL